MGVGAVFVSTLALSKLPTPHSPPKNQQEYLAATLQTIVSFVVLGSILIRMLIAIPCGVTLNAVLDGLSIPFFSFGRRIHSRTVSMSRTLTSRNTISAMPDWLLGVRRMPEGGSPITSGSAITSQLDLEPGTAESTRGDRDCTAGQSQITVTPDANAAGKTQSEAQGEQSVIAQLGSASMIEDPAEVQNARLRRRYAGVEATVPSYDNGKTVTIDCMLCRKTC